MGKQSLSAYCVIVFAGTVSTNKLWRADQDEPSISAESVIVRVLSLSNKILLGTRSI